MFEHLNKEFGHYGEGIRYLLENKTNLKPNVTWSFWKKENDNYSDSVFRYLKVSYFDSDSSKKTLKEIKTKENIQHVCRQFCSHVDIIIEDWERLNRTVGRNNQTTEHIKSHPVCVIREYLKSINI